MLYSVVSKSESLIRRLTRKSRARISHAVHATVEQLESRQLLSVAQPGSVLAGTILTVTGTSGDDNIVVQLVPGDSTHLQVLGAGSSTATYLTSKVKQININGGNGDDSITAGVNIRTIITDGSGNDSITGPAAGHDSITVGAGFDSIQANGAYDYVKAGDGYDTLVGSSGGHDTLIAGNGIDLIQSNGAYDYITVGGGNATITASSTSGHVIINGGSGYDSVTLAGPYDYAKLGNGYDTLVGSSSGHDSLIAGAGADSLTGNGAYDYLLAGAGNDTLISGPGGHSHLQAGNGNDSLTSNGAYDYLLAGTGNDTLTANAAAGHDTLIAGSGTDTLTANGPYDVLEAGSGNDNLTGGSGGHDTLMAGAGTDSLQATGGSANWLQAGKGNDTLSGGAADSYHYSVGQNMVSKNYGTSSVIQSLTPVRALPNVPAGAKAYPTFDDIIGPNGVGSSSSEVGYNNIDTIEAAYSIPDYSAPGSPTGGPGIAGESSQIIAIVDAAGPTAASITSDLNIFSQNVPVDDGSGFQLTDQSGVALLGMPNSFGPGNVTTLPTPTTSDTPASNQFTFQVVLATPNGQQPVVSSALAGLYGTETDLDVEWAHAVAPKATIVLFQAGSVAATTANPEGLTTPDLMFAVNQAALYVEAHGGGVVSMSFGSGEFTGEFQYDNSIFGNPLYKDVSFVASAGDTSTEDSYPAMSPFVTSVGGTTLQKQYFQSGATPGNGVAATPWLEYPWSYGNGTFEGTGAGTSSLEPVPTYQLNTLLDSVPNSDIYGMPTGGVQPVGIGSLGARSGPDVVMLADPQTGVAVYDSTPDPSFGNVPGWAEVGGTSLSAPLFAGVVALANQGRATNHLTPIGNNLNPAIYQLNNSEYEVPQDDVIPSVDMSVTPAAPIIGNFQERGELSQSLAITTADEPIVPPLIEPPTPEEPTLFGAHGLFYNIGGAFKGTGNLGGVITGDEQGSVMGPGGLTLDTDPGWNLASGWGSPNVNELVDSTIPVAYEGTIVAQQVNDNGAIEFTFHGPPTQNLANIKVNNVTQPRYGISVNLPTVDFTAIVESGTVPGATAAPVTYQANNFIGTPASVTSVTSNILQFGPPAFSPAGTATSAILVDNTPGSALADIDFNIFEVQIDPTTGKFGEAGTITVITATTTETANIWFEGQVSLDGTSISGDFYRIQGLDSLGNPISWGNVGPGGQGGNITGSFKST